MLRTISNNFFTGQDHLSQPVPACDQVPASLPDFNELVLAHQDAAYHLASYLLGDPDLAEDVTQKAFLKAYLQLRSFQRRIVPQLDPRHCQECQLR